MADAAVETPASATPAKEKAAKKTKAAGVKKPVKKPTHPKTSDMVNKAIADLKEKRGSSLQAIKKYIVANYKVDADRIAPFVKKYLVSAVETGALVRTKGKGAAGSFKLDNKTKPAAAKKAPKAVAAKKTGVKAGGIKKKPAAKKVAAAKKAAPAKKTKAAATPKKAAPKPKKTPTKAKKVTKPPTKPKTPKAKKAGGTRGRPAGKKSPAKK